jgi:class 3 adenylate cyclase
MTESAMARPGAPEERDASLPVEDEVAAQRTGDDVAEIRARASSLPWWRRPRQLRRQLALTFVATALASVLLAGSLNFFAASDLLTDGTEEQLVGVGASRARTIENGVGRLLGQVSALSGDLGVVAALDDFAEDFVALDDETLTVEQEAALEAHYQREVVDAVDDLGLEPVTVDDFLPASVAGRYLQYHYTVAPLDEGIEPSTVVDAGDGSAYSETHAIHHRALDVMLTGTLGTGDAMLVTVAGDVVYSVDKRIDFGTNLLTGPHSDSSLANALRDQLPRVRAGSAVMADLQLYLPAQGRPAFFAAATVRNDTETIGVLAVEIPVDALSAVTTTNRQWERYGLQSGESYVVGAGDLLLRSESRRWIEDPDGYLDRVDDEFTASLISGLGSPVGLQVVDTGPVAAAIDGETFSGTSTNYLGVDVFSYSDRIAIDGVNWIVVVDVPLSDARSPLYDYLRRLGVVLLIVLPAAAVAGLWLARRLTNPIPPVLDTANAIVEGERSPTIPELGRDEFGDLARRLGNMAEDLGEREAVLDREYDERRQLLLSVLPPRLLDESGAVTEGGALADVATVIAVAVDTTSDELRDDDDRVADLLDQVAAVEKEASEGRQIERVRAAADAYLYVAGVGVDHDGAVEALGFVEEQLRGVAQLREREDVAIGLRIGVASGPIATGVLDGGSLTFGAWGLPVRQAAALAAMSVSNEVLIDASTASAVGSDVDLVAADDVIALDGRSMELYTFPPSALRADGGA